MKLAFVLTALLLTQTSAVSAEASTPPNQRAEKLAHESEMKAASQPLESYIKALETSNPDYIRQAFHKDARVTGNVRGSYVSWPIEEYAARFDGEPADDEAQRKRSFQIIDLTADTAVAKVKLAYPTVIYTDYMILLKLDGQWKIMNKLFHVDPPPAASK